MLKSGINISDQQARTIKVRCFEHEEATPSLVVSPVKQLFNCFGAGCDVGGDLIAFVRQFHHLSFLDAVNWLVENFGLDTSDLVVEKTSEERTLDRYKDINEYASKYLNGQLQRHAASLNVLKGKSIGSEEIQRFAIGYSLNAPGICNFLRSKGVSPQDIRILQFERDDIFTNRLIYPMFDVQGRITHFYGRAIAKASAKYIGMSSTHPLFETSVPYGLHVARGEVSKNRGQLIMVEGHNDVLGLHSHGIRNVAACMGAAPTTKQYDVLDVLNIKNVVICPDADEAGTRTIKAINDNRSTHQHVKIMMLPDGSDPDEFVRDQGPAAFKNLVADAKYPIEFIINDMAGKYQASSATAKLDMSKDAMQYMSNLSGFERDFAFSELASITGVDRSIIEESISSMDEGPMSDLDLERKIIGECVVDKAKAVHAASKLSVDDFTTAKNQIIWNTLLDMLKADIDPFSREMLITYAIDKGLLKEEDVAQVPTVQLGSDHSMDYSMGKLIDLTLRRKLVKSATKLLVDSKAKRIDVREVFNNHMMQLSTSSNDRIEVVDATQQVTRTMDLIHERMSNPGMPGLDIGRNWKKLMNVIMGFQKGHMLVISGVTKAGKTTIALNWNIQQLVNVGEPTLWINLEMNETDLVMRNLSILSGVENNHMKIGNISEVDKIAIDKAATMYYGFKLYVASMAGSDVFEIINTIRRFVYTKGVRVVFIDYIQLIRIGKSKGKSALWEEQNDVVSAIRDIISKMEITGICISQLNRGAMADGSASGQFVSGTIKLIQDSDCFMGIRKKKKEELEVMPHVNAALQIEFNRHGSQGLEIDLEYKHASMRIREG
jgi:DNA primase catalytic core